MLIIYLIIITSSSNWTSISSIYAYRKSQGARNSTALLRNKNVKIHSKA